jgi:nucleoid-associated protein YgaU
MLKSQVTATPQALKGGVASGDAASLEKARLYIITSGKYVTKAGYEDPKGEWDFLECQFNPASLSISKEVSWAPSGGQPAGPSVDAMLIYEGLFRSQKTRMRTPRTPPQPPAPVANTNAPKLEWSGGSAATFSLDLFFDCTQADYGKPERDVRRYTNDLLGLTLGAVDGDDVKEPNSVLFVWGKLVMFEAVITKVVISYLLFDGDGTPTRARAAVDFIQQDWQQLDSGYTGLGQNPTSRTEPRKTWLVEQGQSLHLIAYEEYGHVRHWRHIADSNKILNPLDLQPGQVLVLPPLP